MRGLDRLSAGHPEGPDRLDRPSRVFGSPAAGPAARPGGGVGVERVGLAAPATGLAVGPVDLDNVARPCADDGPDPAP